MHGLALDALSPPGWAPASAALDARLLGTSRWMSSAEARQRYLDGAEPFDEILLNMMPGRADD